MPLVDRSDIHIGGTNETEFLLKRQYERHAFVVVLKDVGVLAIVYARHHDVATFHQLYRRADRHVHGIVKKTLYPWTGSIDDAARAHGVYFTAINIAQFDLPEASGTLACRHPRARSDFCAMLAR